MKVTLFRVQTLEKVKFMIRKMPIWLALVLGTILIGMIALAFWTSRLFSEEIRQPAEICLSNNFPGKSVSIDDLDSDSRSVYSDVEFRSRDDDKFYAAFQEERLEKAKFDDEESFPEIANADEIYRFSWLRTFHNPYIFRAYRIGDDKVLVAKGTDGKGGYSLGSLIVNKTRILSDREWCEFIRRLGEADFWSKEKIDLDTLANDGSFWIIEGIRERRFYIAGEQSPVGGDFRDACIYLMKLSGLNIDESDPDFY